MIMNLETFIHLNKNYDLDYILIILLLGNDYLPKLSNVDYDTIINCYDKYRKHENEQILIDNKINYRNFINYLLVIDPKRRPSFH